MMPHIWRTRVPIDLLISRHRDGELLARTVGHFGFDTIRGSSSRGGGGALREMMRSLKVGKCIGFTPDGPRGPRMRVAEGIISIAKLSGVPIVPACYAISRRKVLASWDRFTVPLPFSRGIYIWAQPILIDRNAGSEATEAARLSLENTLNDITRSADQHCGVDVIRPDPLPAATHRSAET
jgi:lysophospholipid acyltransferase (LPLAT)-like uncharacterized protein